LKNYRLQEIAPEVFNLGNPESLKAWVQELLQFIEEDADWDNQFYFKSLVNWLLERSARLEGLEK
jgi:hypothetical protein